MATITLKGIPDGLHAQLKQRARRNRRSLNSEVLDSLERSLNEDRSGPDEVLSVSQRWQKRLAGRVWLTEEDLRHLKNEGRP